MPSFFEPNQGENGLDQIVNYQLQEKRQQAAEQRYAQREADQQEKDAQKTNLFNLQKQFDSTRYHVPNVYNQIVSDKIAKAQKEALDYLGTTKPKELLFNQYLNEHARDITDFQNNANAVENRIKEIGDMYKGDKFINQTAYLNAFRKKALYDDQNNLLPPEKVDIDAAHKYVDDNPQLYMGNPMETLQKNYLDPQKTTLVTSGVDEKDAKGNKHSVSVKHWDYNFAGAPIADEKGNYTLPILGESFRDEDNNPIAGRTILAVKPFTSMIGDERNRKAILAIAKTTYPNFDPTTNEGHQQMAEVAYNFLKNNARLGVSEVMKDEKVNPIDLQLKQQRLENMQTQQLLQQFLLAKRQTDEDGKPKKLDEFSKNWIAVSKDDKNFITAKPVPITITSSNPYTGNINDGNFGTSAKTVDAFPISQSFGNGRYALGFDEEGKKRYAKEIYRIPNGLIVDDENGNRRVITDPKEFSEFVHATAPFNDSSPLKAAGIIDNNNATGKPVSRTQKVIGAVKNALGIGEKKPTTEKIDFNQFKRK